MVAKTITKTAAKTITKSCSSGSINSGAAASPCGKSGVGSGKIFDVAIIGSGPGGYVCAIRAAQLGLKVAMIEKDELGGICLNHGCIPTKSLLTSAALLNNANKSADFGVSFKGVSFDFKKIISRSKDVSAKLCGGVAMLMNKHKVDVISGFAKIDRVTESEENSRIDGSRVFKVEVENTVGNKIVNVDCISAKNVVVATGASARVLPFMIPDGNAIWDYKHALSPKALPNSIIVVGSGAIGVEFAYFYKTLGVNVTILEAQDGILQTEDAEIAKIARAAYEKMGITIKTSFAIESCDINKKGKPNKIVTIKGSHAGKVEALSADVVLSAVGVVPNSKNIGLDCLVEASDAKLGGKLFDKMGRIVVDNQMKTCINGVFAIGDVCSAGPALAHKASHDGVFCAELIAKELETLKNIQSSNNPQSEKISLAAGSNGGSQPQPQSHLHPHLQQHLQSHASNPLNVPSCIYTEPQIASVGITEAKAKEMGLKVKIGKFSGVGNGKSIAINNTSGLVKTICDAETGEILGAHIVGAYATEMINSIVVAKQSELTNEEIAHSIFPHPTVSEMIHESFLDSLGKALHK